MVIQSLIDRHQSGLNTLYSATFDTPIGKMLGFSDEKALCLLAFTDSSKLTKEINNLCHTQNAKISDQSSELLETLQIELFEYFTGKRKQFNTPIKLLGTSFQNTAWQALLHIPYGATKSYRQQADYIGRTKAIRAVANANAANHIAILVPCHRVIQNDGKIGGYAGGINRKQWLLHHEQQYH